jgi:hypothetical protein
MVGTRCSGGGSEKGDDSATGGFAGAEHRPEVDRRFISLIQVLMARPRADKQAGRGPDDRRPWKPVGSVHEAGIRTRQKSAPLRLHPSPSSTMQMACNQPHADDQDGDGPGHRPDGAPEIQQQGS